MTVELRNSKRTYLGLSPDGRKRWALDCSIGAIQFRENDGEWQDIDPSVEEQDTNGFSLKFTQVPYLGRIGEDSRRRIYPDRTNPNCWIEFKKPYANMPKPSRKDRWFYWDFPTATMGIRFDNTSIKSGFRLKTSDAPNSITIPFETQGITRQGRFLYHDGKLIAELRRPMATDANGEARDCGISFGVGEITVSLDTTGLAFPIEIDPTLDLVVGASSDDCHRRLAPSGWSLTAYPLYAGDDSSSQYDYSSGMRWTGVSIPQGSTIDVAYIRLRAYNPPAGAIPTTYIYGDDEDNAATFSTAADYDARPRTMAYTAWTPAAWVSYTWYNSTSIVSVIKEIIDRPGWASGNALALFWKDADGWGGATKLLYGTSYDYDGPSYSPKLHIEYTAGGQTFYKTVAATAVGSTGLSRIATRYRVLPATAVGVGGLTRTATRYRTLAATAVGVATLARMCTRYRTLAATAVGVAGLATARMYQKVLAATAVGVGSIGRVATFYRTVAATALGSPVASRAADLYRSISATAVGQANITRWADLYRSISATAIGQANITRWADLYRSISATAIGVPGVSRSSFFERSVEAVAIGVASVSKICTYVVNVVATAVGMPSVSRIATFFRTISATAMGSAEVSRLANLFRTVSATAIGSAAVSTIYMTQRSVSTTAQGVASVVAEFIEGGVGILTGTRLRSVLEQVVSSGPIWRSSDGRLKTHER